MPLLGSGGSSWLVRKHGLGANNVVAIEVVTGDGLVDHMTYVIAGDGYTEAELETTYVQHLREMLRVRFQPALAPGHRYDLVFDGQRRNVNTVGLRVTLPDVFRGAHLGYIFQTHHLLPGFTAMENVLLGMSFLGTLSSFEFRGERLVLTD